MEWSKATRSLEIVYEALEDFLDELKYQREETQDEEELQYLNPRIAELERVFDEYGILLDKSYKKDEGIL
jgi:DNA repair ATPase RecN